MADEIDADFDELESMLNEGGDIGVEDPTIDPDNVTTSVVSNMGSAIKSSIDPSKLGRQLQNSVKDSLPVGMGDGINNMLEIGSNTTEVVEKAIKSVRSGAVDTLGGLAEVLPESLANPITRLRSWIKEDKDSYDSVKELSEDDKIKEQVNTVFGTSTKEAFNTRVSEASKELLAKDSNEILANILATNKMAINLKFDVDNQYYKKDLELQLKQTLTLIKMYDVINRDSEIRTKQLEAIVKNTALPDFAKIRNSDVVKEMALEEAKSTTMNAFKDNGYVQSIGKGIKNTIENTSMKFLEGFELTKTLTDVAESNKMMGKTLLDTVMGEAIDSGTKKLLNTTVTRLLKDMKSTGNGGDFLLESNKALSDPIQFIKDYANKQIELNPDSKKAKMLQEFAENISSGGVKSSGSNVISTPSMLKESTFIDGKMKVSITDVVPDLLSKILAEVTTIRKGSTTISDEDKLSFNYGTNRYENHTNLKTTLTKRMSKQGTILYKAIDNKKILNLLTNTAQLKNEEKSDIIKALIKYITSGKNLSPYRLIDNGLLDLINNKSAREKVENGLEILNDKEHIEDNNELKTLLTRIATGSTTSYMDIIKSVSNTTNKEMLTDLGLTNNHDNNSTDTSKVNGLNAQHALEALNNDTSIKGFSDGKFTGKGKVKEAAGIVHREEYVLSKKMLEDIAGDVRNADIQAITDTVNKILMDVKKETSNTETYKDIEKNIKSLDEKVSKIGTETKDYVENLTTRKVQQEDGSEKVERRDISEVYEMLNKDISDLVLKTSTSISNITNTTLTSVNDYIDTIPKSWDEVNIEYNKHIKTIRDLIPDNMAEVSKSFTSLTTSLNKELTILSDKYIPESFRTFMKENEYVQSTKEFIEQTVNNLDKELTFTYPERNRPLNINKYQTITEDMQFSISNPEDTLFNKASDVVSDITKQVEDNEILKSTKEFITETYKDNDTLDKITKNLETLTNVAMDEYIPDSIYDVSKHKRLTNREKSIANRKARKDKKRNKHKVPVTEKDLVDSITDEISALVKEPKSFIDSIGNDLSKTYANTLYEVNSLIGNIKENNNNLAPHKSSNTDIKFSKFSTNLKDLDKKQTNLEKAIGDGDFNISTALNSVKEIFGSTRDVSPEAIANIKKLDGIIKDEGLKSVLLNGLAETAFPENYSEALHLYKTLFLSIDPSGKLWKRLSEEPKFIDQMEKVHLEALSNKQKGLLLKAGDKLDDGIDTVGGWLPKLRDGIINTLPPALQGPARSLLDNKLTKYIGKTTGRIKKAAKAAGKTTLKGLAEVGTNVKDAFIDKDGRLHVPNAIELAKLTGKTYMGSARAVAGGVKELYPEIFGAVGDAAKLSASAAWKFSGIGETGKKIKRKVKAFVKPPIPRKLYRDWVNDKMTAKEVMEQLNDEDKEKWATWLEENRRPGITLPDIMMSTGKAFIKGAVGTSKVVRPTYKTAGNAMKTAGTFTAKALWEFSGIPSLFGDKKQGKTTHSASTMTFFDIIPEELQEDFNYRATDISENINIDLSILNVLYKPISKIKKKERTVIIKLLNNIVKAYNKLNTKRKMKYDRIVRDEIITLMFYLRDNVKDTVEKEEVPDVKVENFTDIKNDIEIEESNEWSFSDIFKTDKKDNTFFNLISASNRKHFIKISEEVSSNINANIGNMKFLNNEITTVPKSKRKRIISLLTNINSDMNLFRTTKGKKRRAHRTNVREYIVDLFNILKDIKTNTTEDEIITRFSTNAKNDITSSTGLTSDITEPRTFMDKVSTFFKKDNPKEDIQEKRADEKIDKVITGLEKVINKSTKEKPKDVFDVDGDGDRDGNRDERLEKLYSKKDKTEPTEKTSIIEKVKSKDTLLTSLMAFAPFLATHLGSAIMKVVGPVINGFKFLSEKVSGISSSVSSLAAKVTTTVATAGKHLATKVKSILPTSIVNKVSKVKGVFKLGVDKAKYLIRKLKVLVLRKLGKKAGFKLTAKLASRLIPSGIGQALLMWDIGWITKYVLTGMSLLAATSKQLLGFDLTDDSDTPVDEDGNPIKPDIVSEHLENEKKSQKTDDVDPYIKAEMENDERNFNEAMNKYNHKHKISGSLPSTVNTHKIPSKKNVIVLPSSTRNTKQDTLKDFNQSTTISSKHFGQANNLALAKGDTYDYRGGEEHLALAKGVRIDGFKESLRNNLLAMANEYYALTGKQIPINSGYRSYQDQLKLKKKYGKRAATPGKSTHEFGLAFDTNTSIADELDTMGLMRKYGFTRPVGKETWHVEPAGIQLDIQRAKNDNNYANDIINNAIGKGGAGWAKETSAPKYSRNKNYQLGILNGKSTLVSPDKIKISNNLDFDKKKYTTLRDALLNKEKSKINIPVKETSKKETMVQPKTVSKGNIQSKPIVNIDTTHLDNKEHFDNLHKTQTASKDLLERSLKVQYGTYSRMGELVDINRNMLEVLQGKELTKPKASNKENYNLPAYDDIVTQSVADF